MDYLINHIVIIKYYFERKWRGDFFLDIFIYIIYKLQNNKVLRNCLRNHRIKFYEITYI